MKISIIGVSGSVGSAAAFYLATERLADEILLITRRRNISEQHALDLGTAVSTMGVRVRSGDYEDMAGSDIVINTAGAPQGLIKDRMEMLPKNVPIVKNIAENIKKYCPDAIVITATNPADPMNYATFLAGGFDRRQVIGYTINDSFRFREFLARAFRVQVKQVGGLVIGEHGSTQVLLFSTASIDGKRVAVSEAIKKEICDEVPLILKRFEELQAGRTAGWTCAIGLAQHVRAIVGDTEVVVPCSVVLDGEYGLKNISMSVPAVLGRAGVRAVRELKLAADEAQGLEVTVATLSNAMRRVEELLGTGL